MEDHLHLIHHQRNNKKFVKEFIPRPFNKFQVHIIPDLFQICHHILDVPVCKYYR